MLLAAKVVADRHGREIVVIAASAAVRRLLDITGSSALFAETDAETRQARPGVVDLSSSADSLA